MNLMKKKKLW